MSSAQALIRITRRKVSSELKGQIRIWISDCRQLKTGLEVSDATLVAEIGRHERKVLRRHETLRLNPAKRNIGKNGETPERRIFQIESEFLEVDRCWDARAGSRGIGVESGLNCGSIERAVAAALRVKELRAIRGVVVKRRIDTHADLRADDGIVDITHHAAFHRRPFDFR